MANTLLISGKCSDLVSGMLTIGDEKYPFEGEIPGDFGIGGGDYITFTLDLDTGMLVGFDHEKIKAGIAEATGADTED